MQRKPKILGRLLIEEAGVAAAAVEAALEEQRASGQRLGEALVSLGLADAEAVARCLALQLGLPYAPPPLDLPREGLTLVPASTARERGAVALEVGGRTLRLGMVDPLNLELVDEVQFGTGRRVEPVVVSAAAVEAGLREAEGDRLSDLLGALPTSGEAGDASLARMKQAASAGPVVRLVDHLLRRAVEHRASDIHVERRGARVVVRFRVDGVLHPFAEIPLESLPAVVSRVKIMAGMDIAVKRRPQDGGFTFRAGDKELAVRASSLPVTSGEKLVLRILDAGKAPEDLGALGLAPADLSRLRRMLARGEGVILAAGPTGSGKSTTLFGALAEVDRSLHNVVTLEDPVEYRLSDVSQVQVRPRAGLTFPAALRSVLRQDPDVVMVGEIRDRETAEIAMAAAVTGHLVLSTIHTVDAPGAIGRLIHMGVPPFLVAGGLAGVVAQRLVRRVCERCRDDPGCDACHGGYAGRTGVFQVLAMTEAMREEVVSGASTTVLRRLAMDSGMGSMADDARRKVAEGVTTPHEVGRVIRGDPSAGAPCPSCGFDAPSGAAGCPSCGARLRRACACGAVVRPGWRYCAACLRPVRG